MGGALVLVFVALAYILPKVFNFDDGLDFRLVWLSGDLWLKGLNPYGSDFKNAYLMNFGRGPVSHFWVYPPNWGTISIVLARLPFRDALIIWNLLNFGCLAVAVILTTKVFIHDKQQQMFVAALTFFFLSTIQSSAVTISIGQTTFILLLAIAFVLYGLDRNSDNFLVVGLVLAMLKPNIGIVVCLAVLLMTSNLKNLLIAGVGSLTLALPAFFLQPPLLVLESFVANVSKYSDSAYVANSPQNLTGLSQLANYLIGANISAGPLLLAACFYLGIFSIRRTYSRTVFCFMVVATILFFVPLHSYDFLLLGLCVPVIFTLPRKWQWFFAIILACAWRAGNIAEATGFINPAGKMFPASLVLSLIAIVFFSGCILFFSKMHDQ